MRIVCAFTSLFLLTMIASAEGPLLAPSAFYAADVPAPSFAPLESLVEVYEPMIERVPLYRETQLLPAPPGLTPIPEGDWSLPPTGSPQYFAMPSPVIELYQRVRVHEPFRKHPRAVPMLVAVPDPRRGCEGCVYVEICVPPCDCPDIRCSRRGNRIVYDFGRHAVVVTSRLGVVHVNYDNLNIRR